MGKSTKIGRRQLLTSAAAAAVSASIFPARALASVGMAVQPAMEQDPVVNSLKGGKSREVIAWMVEPFPMTQVRLRPGPFKTMSDINLRYLKTLENDRLLCAFRQTAGIATTAQPYGGWETTAPGRGGELRGHLSGGHYLSACALMYASTGDEEIKKKADAMVAVMAECQAKNGGGYLSAFPTEEFDRLKNLVRVWAPFYTYHKIMAGQLDMYSHCGNEQALANAEKMADWVETYLKPIPDDQWAAMQMNEHGGMNEALFNLYAITGKEKYLALARHFDHKVFFEPLSHREDQLTGLHANTNVPKVIGAARGYELTGENRYHTIADYFWHEVTSQRIYATGGTSNGEHWNTDAGVLGNQLGTSTEECCVSYNMMKLSRHIFGWTADSSVMDYYERLLYNVRLGTQDPDGMLMYFVSLAPPPRSWKTFGTAFDSMWCCTGSGIEEYAKLNDSIYFHDANGIYVNLFIASEVKWPEKGVALVQDTAFPEEEGTTLEMQAARPTQLWLHVRVPYWTKQDPVVKVNGTALTNVVATNGYLEIPRIWKNGDKIEIELPMHLHSAPLPGDGTLQAAMYGPLVLASRLGSDGLTHEMQYGQNSPSSRPPAPPAAAPAVAPTNSAPATQTAASATPQQPGAGRGPGRGAPPSPDVTSGARDVMDWVEPAGSGKLAFQLAGQSETRQLVPLYQILGERYGVYWKVTPKTTSSSG
jgi:uncharacterized protein